MLLGQALSVLYGQRKRPRRRIDCKLAQTLKRHGKCQSDTRVNPKGLSASFRYAFAACLQKRSKLRLLKGLITKMYKSKYLCDGRAVTIPERNTTSCPSFCLILWLNAAVSGMNVLQGLKPRHKSGCRCRFHAEAVLNITVPICFSDNNDYFLYPHLGQTPFSLSAMPQRGQRSMLFFVSNTSEAALTPLVNVIFAIFSLSFRRS